MTNKTVTKRALTTGALAVLACIAMLIGTTFAWFTDTASTAVNKIVSGNLHVELAYKNADTADFTAASETTKVFRDGALWEPGYTEYVVLKVSNAGSLALKYRLGVNIAAEVGSTNVLNNVFKLSDYIRFAVLDGDKSALSRSDMIAAATDSKLIKEGFTSDETPLFPNGTEGKDTEKIVTLVVWMPTTVGNEANYKAGAAVPSIDLGINVAATQYTYENDSFNDRYDEDAAYPVRIDANVNDEGETVLKDKEDDHTIKLAAPAGSLSDTVDTLHLVKTETATPGSITVGTSQSSKSYEITLKDQNGKAVSADGETLFEVEMQIGKNRTGVSLYHNGTKMQNDGTTLTEAADHFVYDAATGYVTMKVTHFSPFTAVYTKGSWSAYAAESYATPVDETNKVITIASAEELALFAKQVNAGTSYKDYTVEITADIDLGENKWIPIEKWNGTFDGNGHTIKNLYVYSYPTGYGYGFFRKFGNSGTAVMRDVTFDGANVDTINANGSAVIAGYAAYYGNAAFENVTVKNSAVSGFGKVAAFAGMVETQGGYVTFTNCHIANTDIKAAYNAAGFAGIIHQAVSGEKNTAEFADCSVDVRFNCYGISGVKGEVFEDYEGLYIPYGGDHYAESALYFNEFSAPGLPDTVDAIIHNTAYNMNPRG